MITQIQQNRHPAPPAAEVRPPPWNGAR
jgi:hypothetical protein